MTNGVRAAPLAEVRQLKTPSATALVELMAIFEELQSVLHCCERLVSDLASSDDKPDEVVIEAVWTMALLSYARCFSAGPMGTALTEDDLTATQQQDEVLKWHTVLLELRNHYADPTNNPRELFSVGVTQDASGAASGVAVTSSRQPLVDDFTVRQTGAIAYALSGLVNDRINAQQEVVFDELKDSAKADLDKLPVLDVAETE
jgi:hypothetical protein